MSFGGVNPEQVVCLSEGWLIQYMTFINFQNTDFCNSRYK